MLQKIHDTHGKAIWALLAAFLIYEVLSIWTGRFFISRYGAAGPLLSNIASAAVAILIGAPLIHVLFDQVSNQFSQGLNDPTKLPIDPSERAELQTDVAAYKQERQVVGNALGLIGIAIVGFVLYRIIGVVPIVLSALGWKPESVTSALGSGGAIALSVFIAVVSLIVWFVVLNFVFRKLEAKPS